MHEDFSPDSEGHAPRHPHYSHRFYWKLGIIDGERAIPEGTKTPARRIDDHDRHRRDDDRDRRRDDDDDRRGRRDDRSWKERIFRSRSSAADRRNDDRADDRRDNRDRYGSRDGRDARDGRDGGRRRAATMVDTHRKADLSRVQVLRAGAVIPASGCRRRATSPEHACRQRASSCQEITSSRGRYPPSSPRGLALYHQDETLLPRAVPRGRAWLPSSCFGAQVSSASTSTELLPPPPPLPRDGPMLTRLFIPRQTLAPTPPRATTTSSPVRATTTTISAATVAQLMTPPSLCTPRCMLASSSSAYDEPETPVHIPASTPPSLSVGTADDATPLSLIPDSTPPSPAAETAEDTDAPLTPLVVPVQAPLLPAPGSTPPRPPAARRKTLAGVSGFAGFPVQRSSQRLKAKKRDMPIAQLAEKVLCHMLGIVSDGEPVTEAVITKFVQMFNGKLPGIAIAALSALFKLDCDFATAVEDALVEHGGGAAVGQATDQATLS